MIICVVGLCPSTKNIDPDVPLVGTKSFITWLEWHRQLPGEHKYHLINVSNKIGFKPKDITFDDKVELLFHTEGCIVLGLGNDVSKILTSLDIPHFKLPHPSPRNRKLNNPTFIIDKLQECRQYIKQEVT